MPDVIAVLESEIRKCESYLVELKQSLSRIRSVYFATGGRDVLSVESLPSYRGQKVGVAVRQYMEVQHVAALDDIRRALDEGGIPWGKYPKRQVALAVANRPDLYSQKGDVVTMIGR